MNVNSVLMAGSGGVSQQSHSFVSSRKSSCRLSWLSEVAVKVGRQPGFSRPQIRIITSISRSIPRDAPSLMKPKPGRTMDPCLNIVFYLEDRMALTPQNIC